MGWKDGKRFRVVIYVEVELVSWIPDDEFALVVRKMGMYLVRGNGKGSFALGIAR